MSFTDGKPREVTEEELRLHWLGGKPGEYFRCAMCGHKFKVSDVYRFVFTNDMPKGGGNPIVCAPCDGPDVRERWQAKCIEFHSERNWWFYRGERD